MEALRSLLPTRRVEAWKYSDLRAALAETPLPRAPASGDVSIIAALAEEVADITLQEGETRTIVERIKADAPLHARAARIDIAPRAQLTRILIQEAGAGVALAHTNVRLAAGAAYRQFVFAEGARLARIETDIEAAGEDARVAVHGLYAVGAERHADLTSTIRHAAPGGETRQLIKGAAAPGGRGVFQGKILVERVAQKTDARQHHQALLLGARAEIFAKPELMIFADDVACAHGNTIGALDEGALFYMRARGLPEQEARALMIEAFLMEAAPDWLTEDLRAEIAARVQGVLAS